MPLLAVKKEYLNGSKVVLQKLEWLENHGWDQVWRARGDGDCFYRCEDSRGYADAKPSLWPICSEYSTRRRRVMTQHLLCLAFTILSRRWSGQDSSVIWYVCCAHRALTPARRILGTAFRRHCILHRPRTRSRANRVSTVTDSARPREEQLHRRCSAAHDGCSHPHKSRQL